ncbi:Uncharacterised protein [Mycobacteroides abscessus]|nr:Uncharacterised protein [Mycobacteroides abscessus]
MEMNAPAGSRCQLAPREPDSSASRTVMGAVSWPDANVSATSRSFHTQRNWKMPNAAMAGTRSGMRTWKKIFTCPAPSTRAASTSSRGMSFMKLCSRKIASGSAKIECDSHTGQNEPSMPQSTYWVSSGTSVTWMGTIWSAKTATNSRLRPLKFTHANAYAASDASVIGMITAGSVMTRELTK